MSNHPSDRISSSGTRTLLQAATTSTSASTIGTTAPVPAPSLEEILNGIPLIDYWLYNSLTARAQTLIEKYDSGSAILKSDLATDVPKGPLEGTLTIEHATPAGSSSLSITVKDRAGKVILSYIGASVAGTRVLTVDLPNVHRYKYHRQYDKIVVSTKDPKGKLTFRAIKEPDGNLKTEGTVRQFTCLGRT